MRAVCIGECMAELRPLDRDLYALGFAGDAYNAAVYLKRSAPQTRVDFLTATGETPLSRALRERFAAEGVEDACAFIASDREIGLYMIEIDATGERRFHYWRTASAACCWLQLLMQNGGADRLVGVDLVFLSGVSLAILPDAAARTAAIELLRSLKRRVGMIAFDANLRPALWRNLDEARAAISPMIPIADIFRASGEDLVLLTGADEPKSQIMALRAGGAQEIALTFGAAGCIVATQRDAAAFPALPVEVKDTSGAGDAFTGAYLASRLNGAAPSDAAEAALKVAARVITYPGAIAPREISHPEARC